VIVPAASVPEKKPDPKPKPKAPVPPVVTVPAEPPDPGPSPCAGIDAGNLKDTISAKLDCLEQANKPK
jgi:hypothetical protein